MGFIEVETADAHSLPLPKARATSRTQPRASRPFYALPRRPHLQTILMIGGLDAIFSDRQCFRDEICAPNRPAGVYAARPWKCLSSLARNIFFTLRAWMCAPVRRLAFNPKARQFPHMLYKDVIRKYGTTTRQRVFRHGTAMKSFIFSYGSKKICKSKVPCSQLADPGRRVKFACKQAR